MLSFPSQNDNFFSDRPSALEKADLGDNKPTFKSSLSNLTRKM